MSYPQYSNAYQPYPTVPPGVSGPSGATAITAAVLAAVGGVGQLLGGALALAAAAFFREFFDEQRTGPWAERWFVSYTVVSGAVSIAAGIALAIGSAALFARKAYGRIVVVTACVVVIADGIVGIVAFRATDLSEPLSMTISNTGSGIFALIFPVGTAVLALVPATDRWLRHTPSTPPQYPYLPAIAPQPGPGWAVPGNPAGWSQPVPAPAPASWPPADPAASVAFSGDSAWQVPSAATAETALRPIPAPPNPSQDGPLPADPAAETGRPQPPAS